MKKLRGFAKPEFSVNSLRLDGCYIYNSARIVTQIIASLLVIASDAPI